MPLASKGGMHAFTGLGINMRHLFAVRGTLLGIGFVAVLVIGLNDTPDAINDNVTTNEDSIVILGPLANDVEVDVNGMPPDNRLRMLQVTAAPTPMGANIIT